MRTNAKQFNGYAPKGIFTIAYRYVSSGRPAIDRSMDKVVGLLKEIDSKNPWTGVCPETGMVGSMLNNRPSGCDSVLAQRTEQHRTWETKVFLTVQPVDVNLQRSQLHAYEKYLQNLAAKLLNRKGVRGVWLKFIVETDSSWEKEI